jgi:glycosyltransferase involved in cell wall biosynthesis
MSSDPEPLVSVVVSTYNRPARLAALLAGLRAQTLGADRFEVVVVDNGSAPGTWEVLEREVAAGGLRLWTLRHARTLGPAGGRNSGWRAARGALIAFTDDDCVPEPDWLAAGLSASRRHPGAIVQGRTEPESSQAGVGLLTHTVTIRSLGPQYETCNIFYPRAALEELGGFDEGFGLLPGGEDTDLAWRAIESGRRTEFADDAIVRHAVERIGVAGQLRVAARWTDTIRIFTEHPQTRSMLVHRVFWNVWHYLFWRSLVSLAGPRWLARMLVTMHLLQLRRRAAGAGVGVWAIPYLLVHDAVECWAVARGAVRYRTLVL